METKRHGDVLQFHNIALRHWRRIFKDEPSKKIWEIIKEELETRKKKKNIITTDDDEKRGSRRKSTKRWTQQSNKNKKKKNQKNFNSFIHSINIILDMVFLCTLYIFKGIGTLAQWIWVWKNRKMHAPHGAISARNERLSVHGLKTKQTTRLGFRNISRSGKN